MDPCGWEAIVAACNDAFGVTTCKCVTHSDGGCESRLGLNETDEELMASSEGTTDTEIPTSIFGSSSSPAISTEVDAEGRVLQSTAVDITTTLEITFVTDVEVRGGPAVCAAIVPRTS